MQENQSDFQRKLLFANSDHVNTVIELLRECSRQPQLVGENEFATIVNAVTLDANSNLIADFIKSLDAIKQKNFNPS